MPGEPLLISLPLFTLCSTYSQVSGGSLPALKSFKGSKLLISKYKDPTPQHCPAATGATLQQITSEGWVSPMYTAWPGASTPGLTQSTAAIRPVVKEFFRQRVVLNSMIYKNEATESTRRNFLVKAAGLSAALLSGSSMAARSSYGIEGRRAPELAVDYWIDASGGTTHFDLAGNKGKWVFLKCFQSWCPGCHSHGFPALKKISDAFSDNPLVAVAGLQTTFEGFSINTVDKVRDVQLRYDLRIPMGHDAGDPGGDYRPSTMRSYRTGGTPWMILIDPQGIVVFNDFNVNSERLIDVLADKIARTG